ncbi:FtsX-like permease family protein [Oryzobacter telluris]|uniref:ABC transporter permease n=1 Tax=Oryzobacter telluris TaxID=3149179 RepID=UPI00370D7E86
MTTLVRPEERTDGGRAEDPGAPEPGRFATWRSTWTVALRMARRDVRRHRGRSALVVVMVTLPTLLLSLVVTLAVTSDIDGPEKITPLMGNGQALLDGPESGRLQQGADPDAGTSSVGDAKAIPGYSADATGFENAAAVSRLVGAPVSPLGTFAVRLTVGERRVSMEGLALDGSVGLGDRLRLGSGRWPQGATEALVTPFGVSKGLPSSGRATVTVDGTPHTFDVVGTAEVLSYYGGSEGLVVPVLPDGATARGNTWIVRGSDPVTWAEVRALNDYGLRVTSAAALRNPPSIDELPADIRANARGDASQMRLLLGLGAAMLLITTALLVGPAFAVSAARQRRTLALAASNGASTPVLRRTVLAQALVLGSASAVVGTVLGVAATPSVIALTTSELTLSRSTPLDIRWGLLSGIALCAVASTLLAALAPARRLGRLDIVGVMRGQSVSPPPSRLVLLAGVVLTLLGAVVVLGSTGVGGLPSVTELLGIREGGEFAVTLGAVILIVGTLLLVPVILAGVGRLGGRLPAALRMAARDLARHRSRSAPSVAAVLAAVAGLTFGLTGLASDTEQGRQQYTPQTLPGEALVSAWGTRLDDAAARGAAPGLLVSQNRVFDTQDPMMQQNPATPTKPYDVGFLNVLPPGCTAERTIVDLEWVPASEAESVQGPPCMVAGTNASGNGQVLLLPAAELQRRLGLDPVQVTAVRAGAALVRGLPARAVTDGTVTVVRGTTVVDPNATGTTDPGVKVTQEVKVPVVALPVTKEVDAGLLGSTLALASDSAVARDWPTRVHSLTIRDASGAPVSNTVAERLSAVLGDEVGVTVERGFSRDDAVVVAVLLGVFALLILVITLTSTALTLAEQQTDQATLAALGATRGTRRVMAAAAALLLAAVGCLLGVAVGLVPGIAIARPLTSQGWDSVTGVPIGQDTTLVIPWLQLATVGVLVPLVAALMAWAGIRRAPQVTRRST